MQAPLMVSRHRTDDADSSGEEMSEIGEFCDASSDIPRRKRTGKRRGCSGSTLWRRFHQMVGSHAPSELQGTKENARLNDEVEVAEALFDLARGGAAASHRQTHSTAAVGVTHPVGRGPTSSQQPKNDQHKGADKAKSESSPGFNSRQDSDVTQLRANKRSRNSSTPGVDAGPTSEAQQLKVAPVKKLRLRQRVFQRFYGSSSMSGLESQLHPSSSDTNISPGQANLLRSSIPNVPFCAKPIKNSVYHVSIAHAIARHRLAVTPGSSQASGATVGPSPNVPWLGSEPSFTGERTPGCRTERLQPPSQNTSSEDMPTVPASSGSPKAPGAVGIARPPVMPRYVSQPNVLNAMGLRMDQPGAAPLPVNAVVAASMPGPRLPLEAQQLAAVFMQQAQAQAQARAVVAETMSQRRPLPMPEGLMPPPLAASTSGSMCFPPNALLQGAYIPPPCMLRVPQASPYMMAMQMRKPMSPGLCSSMPGAHKPASFPS